jgi:hypothetical protein
MFLARFVSTFKYSVWLLRDVIEEVLQLTVSVPEVPLFRKLPLVRQSASSQWISQHLEVDF